MTALAIKHDCGKVSGSLILIDEPGVERLTSGRETEVLEFLNSRPSHTAYLAGLIHANGLESSDNRGSFYSYRNSFREIEGVALVGHAVTFETITPLAAVSLGRVSKKFRDSILIRGERDCIHLFWEAYNEDGDQIGTLSDERLLELTVPFPASDPTCKLRPAVTSELDQAAEMNLVLMTTERGTDGPRIDLAGFRKRLLQRIKNRQVWVWADAGKIVFKAEIIARTQEVMYLEGIFVSSQHRRKGFGLRALRQLSRILLAEVKSLCVVVNTNNSAAVDLYQKAGYRAIGDYRTIYLKR